MRSCQSIRKHCRKRSSKHERFSFVAKPHVLSLRFDGSCTSSYLCESFLYRVVSWQSLQKNIAPFCQKKAFRHVSLALAGTDLGVGKKCFKIHLNTEEIRKVWIYCGFPHDHRHEAKNYRWRLFIRVLGDQSNRWIVDNGSGARFMVVRFKEMSGTTVESLWELGAWNAPTVWANLILPSRSKELYWTKNSKVKRGRFSTGT